MDHEERMPETTSHSEPSTSNARKPDVPLNAPFPRRLMKKNDEQQFKHFLELLKQLHINIPLIEALEQMPTYVKFFKDILTKKRRVRGLDVGHALCDLGANINLMPHSIFKKLGIGEAQPTSVTLQLADRTIKYPKGKIEDILVKVDNFIFLVDFIILDYEADRELPGHLKYAFLGTNNTLPVIISANLTEPNEQSLLQMLKKHKRAIG
ncbi:uncharacterized protein LOC120073679 [Benincasa hispida]|uniref:uncharacterized protein LOC120073679 n=1 Tax=Benincasa hispida TaxID=102211 RepID=UPI0019011EC2|nr:uncharacterized protein LOC120073679 [Benincasa hispida]